MCERHRILLSRRFLGVYNRDAASSAWRPFFLKCHPDPIMSTATIPEQQYLLLHDKTWDEYRAFEGIVDRRPGCRLTYDRGRMEFMTLSHLHEFIKMLMHDFLTILTDEFEVPRKSGGSTTFRREDLDRGLEPDQSYYLQNEPLVRGKDDLDLSVDPPPDLVVEVEISRSVIDRLGIFAALRVPEVWCTDGSSMRFLRLNEMGEYEEHLESRYFPGIRSDGIAQVMKRRGELEERSLIQSFREWVQSVHEK